MVILHAFLLEVFQAVSQSIALRHYIKAVAASDNSYRRNQRPTITLQSI